MTFRDFVDNKITRWTAILVFCGMLLKGVASAATWADDRWNQSDMFLNAGYATQEQVQNIQTQVDKNFIRYQIQQYQDTVDEIKDMEIDGTVQPSDLKKKHRYETRIRDLKDSIE